MIEEDRYCADVMTQIGSVHEALRAVGRELMGNHLAILRGGGDPGDGSGEAGIDV